MLIFIETEKSNIIQISICAKNILTTPALYSVTGRRDGLSLQWQEYSKKKVNGECIDPQSQDHDKSLDHRKSAERHCAECTFNHCKH